jgi:muramidase (phage lysozyme)
MKQFSSFAEHPFAGREARSTVSGAYGTLVKTWHDYLPFLALPERGDRFTPTIQDRIAITIMEQTSNALGLVRRGDSGSGRYLGTTKAIRVDAKCKSVARLRQF